MKCVNNKCLVDPSNSIDSIVVNIDGDMACCPHCKMEYEKQRNEFFNNIGNDEYYYNWMNKTNNYGKIF
jgi:hypothetical protein